MVQFQNKSTLQETVGKLHPAEVAADKMGKINLQKQSTYFFWGIFIRKFLMAGKKNYFSFRSDAFWNWCSYPWACYLFMVLHLSTASREQLRSFCRQLQDHYTSGLTIGDEIWHGARNFAAPVSPCPAW